MKMIKLALLGGAAMAVTAAAAHADDLNALKAQIETLNARVAAMEAAPAVPAGYNLIAVAEGAAASVPGLEMSAQDKMLYGNKATVISVLPTADAPAGTTITWSGFTRAAAIYTNGELDVKDQTWNDTAGAWDTVPSDDLGSLTSTTESDDYDVKARGEISVVGTTDTAVGEVGVKVTLRGDFDGNGNAQVSMPTAWGYWAMTPELTLGGGYSGSLGNIGYGQDAGSYMYTQAVDFNPGDTTQMRLSYASGPFSAAIALEDASYSLGDSDSEEIVKAATGDRLGVSGEVKYSGDTVSGEISGTWRSINEDAWVAADPDVALFSTDALWQIGAGIGFALGDMGSVSFAAAMGEGPDVSVDTSSGLVSTIVPWNGSWWGASALASFNMTDEIHAELGVGYKDRNYDDVKAGTEKLAGSSEQLVVGGGLYYTPVDQLTIGVEASWSDTSAVATFTDRGENVSRLTADGNTTTVDLVSVWRF